eukprot:583247_1
MADSIISGPPSELEGSTNVAFQCLQDLWSRGDLKKEDVDIYKKRYNRVHEIVLETYESERSLLATARQLHKDRSELVSKVDEIRVAVIAQESEYAKIKERFDKRTVELQGDQEHSNMMQYEIDELTRQIQEVTTLLGEKRTQALSLVGPQLAKLEARVRVLAEEKKENDAAIKKEFSTEEELRARIRKEKDEIEEIEKEKLALQQKQIRCKTMPEKARVQKTIAEQAVGNLEGTVVMLREQHEKTETELQDMRGLNRNVTYRIRAVDHQRHLISSKISEFQFESDELRRRIDLAADLRQQYREDRAKLNQEGSDSQETEGHQKYMSIRYQRQFEELFSRHERVRRKIETVKRMSIPMLTQSFDDLHRKLALRNSEIRKQRRALVELREGVAIAISDVLASTDMKDSLGRQLKTLSTRQDSLESRTDLLNQDETSLRIDAQSLVSSRADLARVCCKLDAEARGQDEDPKIKELMYDDLNKQRQDQLSQLAGYQKAYDILKKQRNQFANKSEQSAHALVEIRERISVHENQIDVMMAESGNLDKRINEKVREIYAAQFARDQLKIDLASKQKTLSEKEREAKFSLLEIEKRENEIIRRGVDSDRTRSKYKQSIADRNGIGVSLIDRNDELCILHEKAIIMEKLFNDGNAQLKSLETEMETVRREIMSVENSIKAARKGIPCAEIQAKEADVFQELEQKIKEEKATAQDLSCQLEGFERSEEFPSPRFLKGEDPDKERALARIELLEAQLEKQTDSLLEKKLIMEEVNMLASNLRRQAADSHAITLELAKRMNGYQHDIKQLTRRMMATCSELSMYQATALKMEQERTNLETLVVEANERLAAGQAPLEAAEHEWYRQERIRQMKKYDLLQKGKIPTNDEDAFLRGLKKSAAQRRPNAYVPDDLGIPKPYGPYLPFFPTSQGSTMRHIRNQNNPEVII